MTARVLIDRDLCIGAGNCIRLARGFFALDDEDVAVLVDGAEASEDDLRSAELNCPVGAIVVGAAGGGDNER